MLVSSFLGLLLLMALAGFSFFGLAIGSNVELPTVSQCSIKLEREDLYTKKYELDWELTCS